MGGIFSMDGILYKIGTLIFDIFFLNVLWIIFSLPIVTIGASTTSLFYVCGKKVRGEDGYIFRDFWKSFKMNFKQSTIIWIIALISAIILYVDFISVSVMGGLSKYFSIMLMVICFEITVVLIYVFPILSKFYIKTTSAVKTAFFMANKHILTTIVCLFLLVLHLFVFVRFTFFMFFMFSSYAYVSSFMFKRVFDKYIPQDEDSEEDELK